MIKSLKYMFALFIKKHCLAKQGLNIRQMDIKHCELYFVLRLVVLAPWAFTRFHL